MKIEDHELIQLELKYCERCGGLWLRLQGISEVYCASCRPHVQDLPAPRRIATRPRLPGSHRLSLNAQERGWILIQGGNA